MKLPFLTVGVVFALSLTACDGKGDTGSSADTNASGDDTSASADCDTDNEDCAPGLCGGDGANMLPGADCLACHTQGLMPEEDEPDKWFTIGGTVFSDLNGTSGAGGVVVRVTDSTGKLIELTSSSAGNFYARDTLTPPLTAEVEKDGVVTTMGSSVSTGACNTCHKCDGAAGGKLHP